MRTRMMVMMMINPGTGFLIEHNPQASQNSSSLSNQSTSQTCSISLASRIYTNIYIDIHDSKAASTLPSGRHGSNPQAPCMLVNVFERLERVTPLPRFRDLRFPVGGKVTAVEKFGPLPLIKPASTQ